MSRATCRRPGRIPSRGSSWWPWLGPLGLSLAILAISEPQMVAGLVGRLCTLAFDAGRVHDSLLRLRLVGPSSVGFIAAPLIGFFLADKVNCWSKTPLELPRRHPVAAWCGLWLVVMSLPVAACIATSNAAVVVLAAIIWQPLAVYRLGRWRCHRADVALDRGTGSSPSH
jgi:hypothetical protein